MDVNTYDALSKEMNGDFRGSMAQITEVYENNLMKHITVQYCKNMAQASFDYYSALAEEVDYYNDLKFCDLKESVTANALARTLFNIPMIIDNEDFKKFVEIASARKRTGQLLPVEKFLANLLVPMEDDETFLEDWNFIKQI